MCLCGQGPCRCLSLLAILGSDGNHPPPPAPSPNPPRDCAVRPGCSQSSLSETWPGRRQVDAVHVCQAPSLHFELHTQCTAHMPCRQTDTDKQDAHAHGQSGIAPPRLPTRPPPLEIKEATRRTATIGLTQPKAQTGRLTPTDTATSRARLSFLSPGRSSRFDQAHRSPAHRTFSPSTDI